MRERERESARREKEALEIRERNRSMLHAVMETEQGRAFVWRVLGAGNPLSNVAVLDNVNATYYALGRQEFPRVLWDELRSSALLGKTRLMEDEAVLRADAFEEEMKNG